MNTILFFAILSLALPSFGQEAVETKKLEKRGLLGLGYNGYTGNYYNGLGQSGYLGYNRYVSAATYPYGNQVATAPSSSIGYGSVYSLGLNNGYNTASYPSAYRSTGYSNLGNLENSGNGVNYLHGY